MVCHYVKWHAEQRDDKISFLPCLFSGDDKLKPQNTRIQNSAISKTFSRTTEMQKMQEDI